MTETAILGGGCFWCTEAIFQQLRGVESVIPGYTGGTTLSPTYEDVCSGTTGHIESAQITFNPSVISYKDLLTVFMYTHDPTSLNRQGNDYGTEYASAIFYMTPEQQQVANTLIVELQQLPEFKNKTIVTHIKPLKTFYPAENYHQDYYNNHKEQSYCQYVISPKLQHLRELFSQKLKT